MTMFNGAHFGWLAICAAIIGGLLAASLAMKWKFKTALYVAVGYSTLSEILKVFSRIRVVNGSFGFIQPSALPLHLCSILIFIVWILAFTKNQRLKNVLLSFYVPAGLAGGLVAVLIPYEGLSFASVRVWQGFIYHSCTVWFSLYLIITKQADLKLKAYLTNLFVLAVMIIIMIWLNGALQIYTEEGIDDVNFFFLVHPPADGLPLLNMNHGYAAYLAVLLSAGFIGITAVHIGPVVKQIIQYRKNTKAG